ncbi:predicted protein [Sclerotinia sclerotiorum 1980 UF-70]|uniref:Uncharacterized protein n=2 Tax=Sclerotinia sclerotiorum (strain ATCC 18683 / 1980 / Ss-1) TaxID=665079 RepID=A7EXC2_SCLS1|nr:predicted protein [Sclerotinia sclerotiorum 1980 UF-70]APA05531.1 hypothetical protein sscle_01g003010 [Sclerotinia sclerotiorum 1980 UF-70]EDN94114.1 predicted protein [Sclerotinia sclerotiorum 1980 UF-70]
MQSTSQPPRNGLQVVDGYYEAGFGEVCESEGAGANGAGVDVGMAAETLPIRLEFVGLMSGL